MLTLLAARRCARAGVVVALLGLVLMLADLAYMPLWGGELVVHSGPRDSRAVPVTSLPGGEQFAHHQKSKTGEVPMVLPLDIHPGDGPIAVVTRDWSWQFDTRFGPGLMELTPERLTYAMGKRERLRRTKKAGRPTPTSTSMRWAAIMYNRVCTTCKTARPITFCCPSARGSRAIITRSGCAGMPRMNRASTFFGARCCLPWALERRLRLRTGRDVVARHSPAEAGRVS